MADPLPSGPAGFRCTVMPAAAARLSDPVSFAVSNGARVLHEMIRSGVRALPVGCRGGGCGACRVRVLDGRYETLRMSRRHISEQDEHQGYVLACRLLASTDLVIEGAPTMAPGASNTEPNNTEPKTPNLNTEPSNTEP